MDKFNKAADFQAFITVNLLKKKDVAEFLNVKPPFITQLLQGVRSLSREKLALIKQNKAWDTSMLLDDFAHPASNEHVDSDDYNGSELGVTMPREVFDQIIEMTKAITSQQETIASQQRLIESMNTKQQERGNAQEDDDVKCADVV